MDIVNVLQRYRLFLRNASVGFKIYLKCKANSVYCRADVRGLATDGLAWSLWIVAKKKRALQKQNPLKDKTNVLCRNDS